MEASGWSLAAADAGCGAGPRSYPPFTELIGPREPAAGSPTCRAVTRAPCTSAPSRRQVRAGLLRHHVGGVPGGPVLVLARPVQKVRPARALLVLAVGGVGPPKRAHQVGRGRESRVGAVEPAGEPGRDLLDE